MTGDPPPPTKRCRKCGATKPVEAFAKNRGYRRTECKSCLREQVAEIRAKATTPMKAAFMVERDKHGYVIRQLAIPVDQIEELTVREEPPNIRAIVVSRLEQRMIAEANR